MKPTETWVLPRPRKNKYPGGFPLHFEKKLWRLLGEPKKVLHPFGGAAEIGDRIDIKSDTNPTFIGDAHNLNFIENSTYDCVIVDPPYDNEQATKIYGTPKLKFGKYVSEAVRVTKPGGFVCIYHWVLTPRPEKCELIRRIVILTRTWHRPRVCMVYRKEKSI